MGVIYYKGILYGGSGGSGLFDASVDKWGVTLYAI